MVLQTRVKKCKSPYCEEVDDGSVFQNFEPMNEKSIKKPVEWIRRQMTLKSLGKRKTRVEKLGGDGMKDNVITLGYPLNYTIGVGSNSFANEVSRSNSTMIM